MSTNLEVSAEHGLLRLGLNRPEKRNALNAALCHDVVAALKQADADAAVRVILLEGRGEVFCAGMDLDEALEPGAAERTAIHQELFTFGEWMSKPVIAAVHGAALAGGAGLVANAHVAVAAPDARFGLTEIRIGLWPYVIYRAVCAAIGERRALELSLTGRTFGTPEALQYGLIHQVAPALDIAQQIASASPQVIRNGMEFARRSRSLNAQQAGALALEFRRRAFESPDFAEGVRAFWEKRKPKV